VVRRKMGSRTKELTVARKSESLQQLRLFAKEALENVKLSETDRGLVLLAIDEVITAIVENSENGEGAMIHLSIEVSQASVKIVIEDTQNLFQFDKVDEAQYEKLRASEKRREIDVFYLSEIMDETYYTYNKGTENRVVMVKFLK
jgi:anti-sigma regulatory factor (Ser/Thr protein kinase)